MSAAASGGTERILLRAWRHMHARHLEGQPVRLGDMVTPLGPHAAALGAALLATPFLWPLSLGPFTMAASALMLFLAWCLWHEASAHDLPEKLLAGGPEGRLMPRLRAFASRMITRFLATPIPVKALPAIRKLLRGVLGAKRRVSRPRPGMLVDGARGRMLCAFGIAFGALVLAIPVPLVPLLNTVPALAIILFGIAFTERDRVVAAGAWITLKLALLFNMACVIGILVLGREAFLGMLGLVENVPQ
jgi:hypothetical protein